MIAPVRIRLSRAKGFDLQAHSRAVNGLPAVNVARPSAWGNPFIVGRFGNRNECVRAFGVLFCIGPYMINEPAIEAQISARNHMADHIDDLRGKNLACWCALDGKPCHADILLRIANSEKGPVDISDFLCVEVGS